MAKDEIELIAQIKAGDHELYRELVERFKEPLFRHCFYIVRDEAKAEDAAQEAFVKAYRQLRKYNPGKASFKTWLYTIATRVCLDELRRNKPVLLDNEDSLASDLPSTEQAAMDGELYQAISRLRPNYRAAIVLHYWHGYSYEEIANNLNAPIGSVRGWLNRAKKELKEALS